MEMESARGIKTIILIISLGRKLRVMKIQHKVVLLKVLATSVGKKDIKHLYAQIKRGLRAMGQIMVVKASGRKV